jgi:hypothetical protein
MAKAKSGKNRKRRSSRKTSVARTSGFSLNSLKLYALPLLAGVAGLLAGSFALSKASAVGLGEGEETPAWKKYLGPAILFAAGTMLFGSMKNQYLKWGAAGVALYGGYKLVNRIAGGTGFFQLNGFYESPNFLEGYRENAWEQKQLDEYSPSYI